MEDKWRGTRGILPNLSDLPESIQEEIGGSRFPPKRVYPDGLTPFEVQQLIKEELGVSMDAYEQEIDEALKNPPPLWVMIEINKGLKK